MIFFFFHKIQGELPHTVKRRNTQEEITVREITVKDSSEQIKVMLWNKASAIDVQPGSTVICKDVAISFNEFHKEMVASVNNEEQIEVCTIRLLTALIHSSRFMGKMPVT